jgi:poly-gamma-glutamate synthesis protein (capsule biosynthesis protein)
MMFKISLPFLVVVGFLFYWLSCTHPEEAVLQAGGTSPESVEQPEKKIPSREFTLAAVGDIMLSRGVGRRIEKKGVDFPFEHVADVLREADIAFGNLESLISNQGNKKPRKEVHFRADLEVVDGLKKAGLDVVSLANNHAVDYGHSALYETMDILAHSRIAYIGAGPDAEAAHRPARFTVNGLKVAFLAYSCLFYLVEEAKMEVPGVAVSRAEDIRMDIEKTKKWADVVVVSFHWGWEYSDHPDEETRELAQKTIEAGADLVVGHHPHVLQGIEAYKGGLICYSLGNFIFDQRRPRTREGLILRCLLSDSGVKTAEWIPVLIDFDEFRPKPVSGVEALGILSKMKKLSLDLDTDIKIGKGRMSWAPEPAEKGDKTALFSGDKGKPDRHLPDSPV